jgi:hypothetical protein
MALLKMHKLRKLKINWLEYEVKRLQLQDHKALRVEVVVLVSRRYIYLYLEGNLSIRRVHSRELWDGGPVPCSLCARPRELEQSSRVGIFTL